MDLYSFLIGVFFVGIIYLLFKISKLQEEVKGIKYILGRIANQMELPENPINNDLRDLIQEGKDVQAVKVARETLGLSLLKRKQYVDALKSDDK